MYVTGNMKIHLHGLSSPNAEKEQFAKIVPSGAQGSCVSCLVSTMDADDVVTQGARASAAIVLT